MKLISHMAGKVYAMMSTLSYNLHDNQKDRVRVQKALEHFEATFRSTRRLQSIMKVNLYARDIDL